MLTPVIFVDDNNEILSRAWIDMDKWKSDNGGCINCLPTATEDIPTDDFSIVEKNAYRIHVKTKVT